MCYRVECRVCSKYSWGGCGEHLKTLYASIDEGLHCMCRSWPGVVIPSQRPPTTTQQQSRQQSNISSQGIQLLQLNWFAHRRKLCFPKNVVFCRQYEFTKCLRCSQFDECAEGKWTILSGSMVCYNNVLRRLVLLIM